MNYVPLYVRSQYSILHSATSISSLVKRVAEFGYTACALTDEEVMSGSLKFYKECLKNNIKPLIGIMLPVIVNGDSSKVLLYAMNRIGYVNLMRLSSRYNYNKAPIDLGGSQNILQGIICITPGIEGIVYQYLEYNGVERFRNYFSTLSTLFDYTFMGITLFQKEDLEFYLKIKPILQQLNIKAVLTNPVYYIDREDREAYRMLRSIDSNYKPIDLSRIESFAYMLSNDDISRLTSVSELINNTSLVASLCNVEIELGKIQIPRYDENVDANLFLKDLGLRGLKKRLSMMQNPNVDLYTKRFNYEYEVICKMGFADYFLIVWDYVLYAKKNDIYVGPGRGSAGASLVAFCLGITDVDPIKYNLLFERFLNIERITMPDIDMDFPNNQRGKLINYVKQKYGQSNVAHIGIINTFQITSAINDVSKVLNTKSNYVDHVKQLIKKYFEEHPEVDSKEATLEKVIAESTELQELMNSYQEIDTLLNIAKKIFGLPKNVSTHAAGILITKNNLVNYTALIPGGDGIFQTQLESGDLESLGLLKMDFLNLKYLTNIKATIDLIKKDNPSFKMPREENDPKVFNMLASGYTGGIFQLESEGMTNVIMNLKTSSINDLICALALYRPGPMKVISNFIDRKFGREKITYLHEDLRPILQDTYGMIIYQEQIMLIAVKFAGYTLGRADVLRRAVSKKKRSVLESERTSFVESSVKCGYDENIANTIYDYIVEFADYGFNKSHSVAYAKFAYQTAYLKCYYPTYYLSTLMTTFLGDANDILTYTKEAQRYGIKIYGPNVNVSSNEFVGYNNGILYPLNAVAGIGEITTRDLVEERNKGSFKTFKDFVIRTRKILSIANVEYLIYAGALDDFGITKKGMIENIKKHIDYMDYEGIPGLLGIKYTEDEFEYSYLLQKEKDALGRNLKYSFTGQYASIYKAEHLQTLQNVAVGTYIRTIGIVNKLFENRTKKDEMMCRFNLEDDYDDIRCVVFPSVYNMISKLNNGIIVIVIGKVGKDNRDKIQIVVDQLKVL